MKSIQSLIPSFSILSIAGLLLNPMAVRADSIVDDFSDATLQASGIPRMIIDDNQAGGQSHATASFAEGIMTVEGKIVPGRGSPGFVSIPLMLNATAEAKDVSQYTGIQLRVKVDQGSLMIQVSSTEVTNFDYHTSAPIVRKPGEFQDLKIPFSALKRVWSEQTELNLETITGINLVSAGMAPDSIAYHIDEVRLY